MMDYFRRPLLAGTSLTRLQYGTIHGSVRRSDPDSTSTVPYFPGLLNGQTLVISTDTGNYTATFTSAGFAAALAAINSALSPAGVVKGVAWDADGSIAIRTATKGGSGWVGVTGGSARIILGFDTVAGPTISCGGDVPYAPEARQGNWMAAFPTSNENLETSVINRALARLAANTDVLHADLAKDEIALQEVAAEDQTISENRTSITLSDATRVYTGSPLALDGSLSTLQKYYRLIDPVTGCPAASQVIAVTRGVTAAVPTENCTGWGDTSGKNVLGQSLPKVTATAVTGITDQKIIYAADASFQTAGVVVGDLVEISGATNTYPWSNSGNRWCVEDVLDEQHVVVRPLSKAELISLGVDSPNSVASQPIVELNGQKTSEESFGTVTVRNGFFTNGVTLLVSPPIPEGATLQLLAAQPVSTRDRATEKTHSVGLVESLSSSTRKKSRNAIISGFHCLALSGTIEFDDGFVRWNDRLVRVPGRAFTKAELPVGIVYFYWDEINCTIAYATTTAFQHPEDPEYTSEVAPWGTLLARADTSGNDIYAVVATRYESSGVRTLTAGKRAEFQDLAAALAFIDAADRFTAQEYQKTKYRIILVSDNTGVYTVPTIRSNITIEGAVPDVQLQIATPWVVDAANERNIVFKNLQLFADGTAFSSTNGSSKIRITLRDVRAAGGSVSQDPNVELRLESCRLIGGAVSLANAYVRNSAYAGSVTFTGCDVSGSSFSSDVSLDRKSSFVGNTVLGSTTIGGTASAYLDAVVCSSNMLYGQVVIDTALERPVVFSDNVVDYRPAGNMIEAAAVFAKRGSPFIKGNWITSCQVGVRLGDSSDAGLTVSRAKVVCNDIRFRQTVTPSCSVAFAISVAGIQYYTAGQTYRWHVFTFSQWGVKQYTSDSFVIGSGANNAMRISLDDGRLGDHQYCVVVFSENMATPGTYYRETDLGGYGVLLGPGPRTLTADGNPVVADSFPSVNGYNDDVPAVWLDQSTFAKVLENNLIAGTTADDGAKRFVYVGPNQGGGALFGMNHMAGHGANHLFQGPSGIGSCYFMADPTPTAPAQFGGTFE